MVRLDQIFQLSIVKLFNVQFPHDVSLGKKGSVFTCNFSKFITFFNLNFFVLLDNSFERYLDGLLHNLVLGAAGSSSSLFLSTLIIASDEFFYRGLLTNLLLKL